MSDEELKPCPFCGEPAEVDMSRSFRAFKTGQMEMGVAIYCSAQCHVELMLCCSDLPEFDTDDLFAILAENWNKRALSTKPEAVKGEAKTEARISDLEKALRGIQERVETAVGAGVIEPPNPQLVGTRSAHIQSVLFHVTDVARAALNPKSPNPLR